MKECTAIASSVEGFGAKSAHLGREGWVLHSFQTYAMQYSTEFGLNTEHMIMAIFERELTDQP